MLLFKGEGCKFRRSGGEENLEEFVRRQCGGVNMKYIDRMYEILEEYILKHYASLPFSSMGNLILSQQSESKTILRHGFLI